MNADLAPEVLWPVAAAGALLALRSLLAGFEAAMVAVGLPRAQELAAAAGASSRARRLLPLLADPEPTLAAVRLVGTGCSLAAGALAAFAGAELLPGARAAGVALLVAAATLLSVALSAGARALGSHHGEPTALALAPAVAAVRLALGPVGRLLSGLVRPLAGSPGRYTLPPPPLEEMERALAALAEARGGASGQTTSDLIHAVFEFREKTARDVMVPRTEVVAVDEDTPVSEIIRLLAEEGHSRVPVYRESLDRIVGFLHARDLVPLLANPGLIVLRDLVRPPHFVPWSKPVEQLLREMQRLHLHMVVVVDEYGGVMGICTIEDVLEEIVGEIDDEFSVEQGRHVETHPDGSYTVLGETPVSEFNRSAQAELPEDQDYETVAGFLNALAGAIPAAGDRFFWRGWLFTVAEADPRRVTKLRAVRVKRPGEVAGGTPSAAERPA
ncbi:hemolysin family protein [Anaeromyxobacter paludicola]|uniref:hemolysin family protein n=1 Tax=Anaeromyxobacter paludicola TaxID=2918171 RepID=UPI0020C0CD1B|nr:hemolysin family protein [Anaeromyxobacter paludicola]